MPAVNHNCQQRSVLKKLISYLNDSGFVALNLGISLSRAIFGLSPTAGITYQQVTNSSCGLRGVAVFLSVYWLEFHEAPNPLREFRMHYH
jgi:hypothetical protein